MIGLVVASLFFGIIALLLRGLAGLESPRFATIIPANNTALVTKKENTLSRDKNGNVTGVNNDGGSIVRVLHAVPGKRLNKKDHDAMNWRMEAGREWRGLFFILIDIQFIWLFRYLRINEVRTFRWGRKSDEDEYHMMAKTSFTRYRHFSGQHDIEQKHVETREIIKFDMRFNLTVEETYPVRVSLRVADAYAQLTMIVNDHVIDFMGDVDPKQFIGAKGEPVPTEKELVRKKENLKNDLVSSFGGILQTIEDETGITVRKIMLPDFDFDEATKKLLEAKTRAILESEAELIRAEKDKQIKIKVNEADAHRIANVIKPLAADDRLVKVAAIEAYRDNKTVTHLVLGQNAIPVLPLDK